MKIADHFKPSLAKFDLESFDDSPDIVYGVDGEMRLAYLNDQWTKTALQNNADESFLSDWGLGALIDQALGGGLAPFYLDKFERSKEENEAWEHEYMCPSPSKVSKYRMRILPLDPEGWLVIHTKIFEQPRQDEDQALEFVEDYRDSDDLFRQCSHCGRFRRPGLDQRWDFVPTLFREPPDRTSHGLCETCYVYYYGDAG